MTLRHWDVRKDVPEDLVGLYDIVHVRNFAFVLQGEEIPHVLGNLIRLIRTPIFASVHFLVLAPRALTRAS